MPQSSTLDVGMDVHNDSIAVAYVAKAPSAEVVFLGAMGSRQCEIEPRIRKLPSQSQLLVLVYEAGPGGSGLSRDLTNTGRIGWVVAPSLRPNTAGDRGNTERRDAVPLARLRRSGDLTPV